jgi:hypothetical protein
LGSAAFRAFAAKRLAPRLIAVVPGIVRFNPDKSWDVVKD